MKHYARLLLLSLIISLGLFTSPLFADQLVIEPEMGRAPILNLIDDSKHSLQLVIYGFTDDKLLQALLAQHKKGRHLKVLLEQSPYKRADQNKKTIAAFEKEKVNWQGSIPPYRLIHEKMLIIDGKKALVMTFNFTKATFKNERNFALLIDDPKRLNAIKSIFAADWEKHPSYTEEADVIVSPDDSREKITRLLNRATQSLHIYAQNIDDHEIINLLAKAAKKGIAVQILTSNLREKERQYLTEAGAQVLKSKKYHIHAKVIVIDAKMAILGSTNLTRSSLDDNRELSIVVKEKPIVDQLMATFKADWTQTLQ